MKSQKTLNYQNHKGLKTFKTYNVERKLKVSSKRKNQIHIPSYINIPDECSCTSNLFTPIIRMDKVDNFKKSFKAILLLTFLLPVTHPMNH